MSFHDISLKNYLILYTKRIRVMKHDEIKSSQINEFCLKQRQGLKASAAPLYP